MAGSREDGVENGIVRAQLTSALTNLTTSLIANSFIGVSTALIVSREKPDPVVLIWLAAFFVLNAIRLAYGRWQLKRIEHIADPKKTLNNLTLYALAGGLVWAIFPLYLLPTIDTQASAYTVFILTGISTGAIIQSLAYWRISVAFGTPILAAVIFSLLAERTLTDDVVALNVLLLMAMLFRVAVLSEAGFRKNFATTLQAVDLAQSLQDANEEVRRANETLKRLASTDPLTGLANRSVFNQLLGGAGRADQAVSLAVIDVDHFKQVNDTHGHQIGDAILCSVALAILDNAKGGMTAIRLGGDEFAVVAMGPDGEERLSHFATRLRQDVTRIAHQPGLPVVTVSIGICADVASRLSAAELLEEADRALYAAKAAGRNCLRHAGLRTAPGRSA